MPERRPSTTYRASDQARGLLDRLTAALQLSRSDVIERALIELARREGLAPAAAPPRPRRRPQRRVVADPPGLIGDDR